MASFAGGVGACVELISARIWDSPTFARFGNAHPEKDIKAIAKRIEMVFIHDPFTYQITSEYIVFMTTPDGHYRTTFSDSQNCIFSQVF